MRLARLYTTSCLRSDLPLVKFPLTVGLTALIGSTHSRTHCSYRFHLPVGLTAFYRNQQFPYKGDNFSTDILSHCLANVNPFVPVICATYGTNSHHSMTSVYIRILSSIFITFAYCIRRDRFLVLLAIYSFIAY